MSENNAYWYFEACGFVSEPFTAADLANAEAHVLATFRNPANPDFDGDDGGLIAETEPGWWEDVAVWHGNTDHNPDNADRLADAIHNLVGETAPTPGHP